MNYLAINDGGTEYRSGIYCIETPCGKQYVGSAVKVRGRFASHRYELKGNRHDNPRLQNYVNKHGIDKLKFYILEICEVEILLEREQYYIDTLNPFFNILKIAGTTRGNKPWLGKRHTEETKRKMSESNKRFHIENPKPPKPIVKKLTYEENVKRFADLNKSESGRKRLSEIKKGNTYWLGKKHKPETIEARKGGLNPRARKVMCELTGLRFDCALDACKFLGVSRACVPTSIKRNHKVLGKYKFKYAED